MKLIPTALDGVVELVPRRHGDDRGWFSEVWNEQTLIDLGIEYEWVQDNEAWSAAPGTLRGIHFQIEPRSQTKLVRCSQGRVLDVAVDLRRSSPSFGQHVGVELSAEVGNQLLVPAGFGHAYCTLETNCVINYKVTDYYSPDHDRGVRWDDQDLAIAWPFPASELVLSDKDRLAPTVAESTQLFG